MNGSPWVETLLWRLRLSRRALRVWSLVLLLAPAAWVGGFLLRYEIVRATWPQTLLNRAETLSQAAAEARRLGFDTTGWSPAFALQADEPLDAAMREQSPEMRGWLYANMPPRAVRATFHDPRSNRSIELDVNPRGDITGYQAQPGRSSACADDEAGGLALARAVFARRFARWPALRDQLPTVSQVTIDNAGHLTRYGWQVNVPELPAIGLRLEVDVSCSRVVADRLTPDHQTAPPRKGWHVQREEGRSSFAALLVAIYFMIAIPWIAVRYVKRTIQGEAPQGRILLAGAIFAAATVLSYFDKASTMRLEDAGLPLPVLALLIGLGIAFLAALFGMAYAAAEGEVRELYPGTLTSLDALLTGRWNTRNAGSSMLLGMALGGWLLLTTQGAALLHARRPVDISEVEFAFARISWLSALTRAPLHAVLIGIFGLLVPLALFHRWTRRAPRLHPVLVFLAATIGFSVTAPANLLALGSAIWGLACALCLFAAFVLAADLLAGLAALTALQLGLSAGVVAAVSSDSTDLAILLGFGLVTCVAAVWAARYGRVVRDEEVRPRYAANLAERLRLEHEIDATRLAQQRLLPGAFPELAGLSAAALCLPAREVAGDFYDAYALSGGRLAVLLAEGGGQRLARALSIALVKGYVMEKSSTPGSPGELLAALHATAGGLVAGSTGNLCYAVIDPVARTLRYARTGDWPAVLVRRTADSPATPCAESTRRAGALAIQEGAAALEPGSLLLLYTDAIARRGALVRRLRRERFEENGAPLGAGRVVASVMAHVSKRARRKLDDDLTLVAVRLDATAAARREEVA
jgi:hypothetical protein